MFEKYTRLKYHLTETTNLEPRVLIDRAVLEIQKSDCKIISKTDKIVTFKDDGRGLRFTGSLFRNMDEGTFEINTTGEKMIFKLTHYVSLQVELILIPALILLGLFVDAGLFIFVLGLLIHLIIRIDAMKTLSKRIMMDVIKS